MIIYQLKKGDTKFTKIAHVPTGFSVFWIRNFSFIRRLTIRPECIEMATNNNGDICALSAGKMWTLKASGKKFTETKKLSNYGFGDQGIRNNGILNIDDSTYVFGEYYRNPNLNKVSIFKSCKNLSSWKVAYEFQPGQIRHIHAIQKDPYTGNLWVSTGDNDKESLIANSNDKFKTVKLFGQGQQFKACQLVFTEEAVFWGTDTDIDSIAGIYRWDRYTSKIEKLQKINGAIFFGTRLANGTIIMSSNREGFQNEIGDKTSLYIIPKDKKITSIECGTWNHKTHPFMFKYAMLRFQRDQGASSLAMTILNQKEFPDSELVIISEDNLIDATKFKGLKNAN